MDPLGFGLENFDGVGRFREEEGGARIDPSGVLPDGRRFDGPRELRAVLRSEAGAFRRTLAGRMLTYATGRGLGPADGPQVDRIARSLADGGDRFSALIAAVVTSEPFRMRRGEGR